MDIIYVLILMFTLTEDGLSSTTTVEISGYKSLEACEAVLELTEEALGNEVDSFAGMCFDQIGA